MINTMILISFLAVIPLTAIAMLFMVLEIILELFEGKND